MGAEVARVVDVRLTFGTRRGHAAESYRGFGGVGGREDV